MKKAEVKKARAALESLMAAAEKQATDLKAKRAKAASLEAEADMVYEAILASLAQLQHAESRS